jgi:hypothetical protein
MKIKDFAQEEDILEGWVSSGIKMLARQSSTAAKAASKSARAAQAAEIVATHYGDKWMKFLYAADIAKEVIAYNIKANKLNKDDPNYQEQLRNLRGQFIVAVVAPKVAMWIGNKLLLTKVFNILPWVLQKSGLPGAGAIVRQLSFKGAELAMLGWWTTDSGKKWLTDTFGTLITGVGTLPEIVGDVAQFGKAAVQVATGNIPANAQTSTNGGSSTDIMNTGNNANDPFKGTSRAGGI